MNLNLALSATVLMLLFTVVRLILSVRKNRALKTNLDYLSHVNSTRASFSHRLRCTSCSRTRAPGMSWGDKFISHSTWRERIKSHPEKDSTAYKYGGCYDCGTLKRRGRSPRNPQGHAEEASVLRNNSRVYDAGKAFEWGEQ